MTTEIQKLEMVCSQMQMNKLNKEDTTALGIGWVLLSLEKNMKEENAIIKGWEL
jgi:hypothetical protein